MKGFEKKIKDNLNSLVSKNLYDQMSAKMKSGDTMELDGNEEVYKNLAKECQKKGYTVTRSASKIIVTKP